MTVGKSVLQHMQPYKQGMQIDEVKRLYGLNEIVKLASNENPFGFSDKVREAFETYSFEMEMYPDGYAYDLRKKLAGNLQVQDDQLVFGSGSDELIAIICRTFLHEGTNTVMASPTFPQYRHSALIEGAEVREVPTVNGRHQLDQMLQQIDENTKVVWLCTPDNPSGELIEENDFLSFIQKCPSETVVVLDEAYYEFVDQGKRYNLLKNLASFPNLIVLRTFSKAYGLANLRLGYAIASERIANLLNVVRSPFNTTSLSQYLATVALNDNDFVRETKKLNDEIKASFQTFLDDIGWTYNESHTNFLLVHTPVNGNEMAQYLLEHGYIVRSGALLGYPNTVRITIGTKEQMDGLQSVIRKFQTQQK